MSEYWVSKKRYWCKYCETYIADDVPSRQQHENGLRHKGNKERFVRGLYKQAESKRKDEAEERREMARIDQAAQAAFASDVSSGHAKASSSTLPAPRTSASSSKPADKPASQWTNYSTAESLGYTDLDAERVAAETELKRTQGVAGDWEVVQTEPKSKTHSIKKARDDQHVASGSSLVDHRKRDASAASLAVPVDEEDTRAFKVRKKTWGAGVGLGELWEPEIPIKLKPRKVEPDPEVKLEVKAEDGAAVAGGSTLPKWTTRGWNEPGTLTTGAEEAELTKVEPDTVALTPLVQDELIGKSEDRLLIPLPPDIDTETCQMHVSTSSPLPETHGSSSLKVEEHDARVKLEDSVQEALSTAGMFRKRKAPNASAGSRSKR